MQVQLMMQGQGRCTRYGSHGGGQHQGGVGGQARVDPLWRAGECRSRLNILREMSTASFLQQLVLPACLFTL